MQSRMRAYYIHPFPIDTMSILVVGTVAYDAIETPFGKVDRIEGGSAYHFARSAAFFHKPVQVVSVVGADYDPASMKTMTDQGIDTTGVEVQADGKTFFWSGRYHNDLNRRDSLVTDLNVLATFDPKLPEATRTADYLMLGNLDPKIQLKVIRDMARKPRLIIMDTMNFWMDIMMDEVKATLAHADVLIVNDEEARQLSGEYSLVKAARAIQALGPKYIVVKKGEHGALLFGQNEVFYAPALPLEEVYDPTGAGDTFAGGFMGYLASSGDVSFASMKSAVIYGSAMASYCVEDFGTRRYDRLTLPEVQARVRTFLDLVSCDIKLS